MTMTKKGKPIANQQAPKGCPHVKAGQSIVDHKPLFTFDSRFLIVPCESSLKVFSTQTGECIKNIKTFNQIVSVQQNPENRMQVISCEKNGLVIFWDYQDSALIKRFQIKLPKIASTEVITFLVLSSSSSWVILAKKKAGNKASVWKVDQRGGKAELRRILADADCSPTALDVGCNNDFVAAIHKNELHVASLTSNKNKKHLIPEQNQFKCVACHSSEYMVMAGETKGKIFIWWDVLNQTIPPRACYHWHTLPVADLALTVEGIHMYSGGGECVLVKWKLGTEFKSFVARMGLPIRFIVVSPDNQLVATSHLDNAIQLTNTQNKISKICQGFAVNFDYVNDTYVPLPVRTGLLFDPRSKHLVLNGRPGHLQFYSLQEDKLVFHLDIVNQNYRTQERHQRIVNFDVEKAAFDHTGRWLATVECRDDGETSLELNLRFWHFDDMKQEFQLNTCIILPHNKHVNHIKFQPSTKNLSEDDEPPILVTASQDKKFKVWALQTQQDAHGTKMYWTCKSLGYYRNFEPKYIAFSEDGSLLAVPFECYTTLWTPDDTSLQGVLYHPMLKSVIQQVEFGRKSCSHLIVCVAVDSITVWNLLDLTRMWTVENEVSCFAVDPVSEFMAVFTNKCELFVFKPDNPEFLYCQEFRNWSVSQAIFIPHQTLSSPYKDDSCLSWQKHSQLYFMNQEQKLLTLYEDKSAEGDSNENQITLKHVEPLTPYGMIIAKHKKVDEESTQTQQHQLQGVTGMKEVKELLNVPCHVLPPVSMFCANFLSSVLFKQKQDRSSSSTQHDKDDNLDKEHHHSTDDEMDVDNPTVANTANINTPPQLSRTEEEKLLKRLAHIELEDYSFLKMTGT